MSSNWEKFLSYYNQANAAVQRVIDSAVIPKFADKLVTEHNIPTTERNELASLLADVVLRILSPADLKEVFLKNPHYAPLAEPIVFEDIELYVKKLRNIRISNMSATGVPEEIAVPGPTTRVGYGNQAEPAVKPLPMNEAPPKQAHGYGVPSYSGDDSEEPVHNSNQTDVIKQKPSDPSPPTTPAP